MGKSRKSGAGAREAEADPLSPPPDAAPGACALCGRPLVPGPSVEQHHLVPRSAGGRVTVPLHRVCHRKIHAELTERALAGPYATLDSLRAHPAIAAFIRWVATKPPEFVTRTEPRRR